MSSLFLLAVHVKRSIQKCKMLMWKSVQVSAVLPRKYLKNFVRYVDYCLPGYHVMLTGKSFPTLQKKLLSPGWKNLYLEDGIT
jgi:hypothetical protein